MTPMEAQAGGHSPRLAGQVALVTGGASGIGRGIAEALARAGAAVAVADVRGAEEAAAAIAGTFGVPTLGLHADVGDEASVDAAAAAVERGLGAPQILVNNAGIMAPRLCGVVETAPAEFDAMLAVHLRGAFLMARRVVPAMTERGYGRVVNMASLLATAGFPNRVAYSVAKAGIVSLTRTLALETARRGVTVNAIAPGYILTDTLRRRIEAGMIDHDRLAERAPAGRWGRVEEIASAALFLADPGSAFITGIVLPVDGGFAVRGDPGDELGPRPSFPDMNFRT